MKLLIALLALVLVPNCVFADDDIDESDVTELDGSNFDAFIAKPFSLVEFYAPWCGHCKQLKPAYAEAATKLKKEGIPLGKVDATENRDVSGRYDVSGYPTLKVFRNSEPEDYTGGRSVDEIVSYLKSRNRPQYEILTTKEDIEAYASKDEGKFAVIGFFASPSSQVRSAFSVNLKKIGYDFYFAMVLDKELIAQYGGDETDFVMAFRNYGDKARVLLEGKKTTTAMRNFIFAQFAPPLSPLSKTNKARLDSANSETQGAMAYLFMDSTTGASHLKYHKNRVKEGAALIADKVPTYFLQKTEYPEMTEQYGIGDRSPVLVIVEDYQTAYMHDGEFNKKEVTQFYTDYKAKNLPQWVKSEQLPKTNDGPVKVIVGKNFEELVKENDAQDIFIEFYAPWCGHCKALEPKWKQLGEKVQKKGITTLMVAKCDATANHFDREMFPVSGYPSIFFKKAGSDEAKKYEGAREIKDMWKFLKKNVKHKFPKKAKKASA